MNRKDAEGRTDGWSRVESETISLVRGGDDKPVSAWAPVHQAIRFYGMPQGEYEIFVEVL